MASDGHVLGHRKLSGVEALSMKTRLRVLRAEREWSQADLAERLHVSRQTINAIENGKYDPSLSLAFHIAKLFARSIEDVFLPDETERTST
jgi:putative transcriptional regulator